MSLKRKSSPTFEVRKRQRHEAPKRYDCPEGNAFIEIGGRRIKIRVLLDSGSHIFLLNTKLVREANIPYTTRPTAVEIRGCDGTQTANGGKHFTHSILLKIALYSHRRE